MDTISDASPIEGDYAVQPLATDVAVPVDGPVPEAAKVAVELADTPTDSGPSSVLAEPTLGSPLQSPVPVSADDTSESSPEDGEIRGEVPKSTVDVMSEGGEEQETLVKNKSKIDDETEGESTSGVWILDAVSMPTNHSIEVTVAEKAEDGPQDESGGLEGSGKAIVDPVAPEQSGAAVAVTNEAVYPDLSKITQAAVDTVKSNEATKKDAAVTDTEVEYPKLPQPASSVPPHMRPGFQRQDMRTAGLGNSQVNVANTFRHNEN